MTRAFNRLARFPWRRISGFVVLQLVSAVIPLVVLPFIVRMVGPGGWAGLSLGYSVGAAAAVVVNFGWIIVGPGRVSGIPAEQAERIYSEGIWTRLVLVVPVVTVAAISASALAPAAHGILAAAMAISLALTGLSPTWFYIGRGQPSRIALFDTLPRIIGSLASIPLLYLSHNALVYPAALGLSCCIGVASSARVVLGRTKTKRPSWEEIWARLKHQSPLAISGLIMVGYTSLSVAFVSIGGRSIATVADYAAASRLRSAAQAGIGAFTSGLQGWASERTDHRINPRKMKAALAMNSVVGLFAGAFFVAFGSAGVSLLFGAAIKISQIAACWVGVACFLYAIGASLSYHILGPLGAVRAISNSNIAASIVGIPLIIWLTSLYSTDGATAAVALAELIVVLIQTPIATRALARVSAAQSS